MIMSEDFGSYQFRELSRLECSQSSLGLLTERPTRRNHCGTMAMRKNAIQVIVDVVIVLVLIVLLGLLLVNARPAKRGFFCDDESIRYPYRSDTVTAWMLFGFSILIVLVCFIVVEVLLQRRQKPQRFIRRTFDRVGRMYGIYLFGLAVTLFITEVGKLTIGRLRPHFIDVCKPDFANIDCTQGYIVNFTCTSGMLPMRLIDARKSFPSGHSSMAFFCACYLGYYIQRRLHSDYTVLWRQVFQMLLCAGAFFTSLSRVTDHKHHATDVLCGALIGICVAFWAIVSLNRVLGYDVRHGPMNANTQIQEHYDDAVDDPTFTRRTVSDGQDIP